MSHERTARVSAEELKHDAKGVALSLIGRLLEAMRGALYSPFEEAEQQEQ